MADHVTEGESLTWRLTLSAVADVDLYPEACFLPTDSGRELSITDVDPDWLGTKGGVPPEPSQPLSSLENLALFSYVEPGQLIAEIGIPTVTDGVAEPEERVRLKLDGQDMIFTGAVADGK